MTLAERLDGEIVAVEANAEFTEAVIELRDESRLYFCHRVGERWAKATGRDPGDSSEGEASSLLSEMVTFRLNAKHLDIQFADGSRWDRRVPGG